MSDHSMAHLSWEKWSWYLWLINCPILLLLSKRWQVLTIKWPTNSSRQTARTGEAGTGLVGSREGAMKIDDGFPTAMDTWVDTWKLAIIRAALSKTTGRLESSETDNNGNPWKPLGDFDEVRPWGGGQSIGVLGIK